MNTHHASRFTRKEDDVVQNGSAMLRDIRAQIVGLDVDVPLLDGSTRRPINFDNAASAPALRPVLDTLNDFMLWYSGGNVSPIAAMAGCGHAANL
jgi:hypothetical protein